MIIKKEGDDKEAKATILLVADRPGHDLRYDVDWTKSKRELGWEPKCGVGEILERTIEWYKKNRWWWEPLKKKKVVVKHK